MSATLRTLLADPRFGLRWAGAQPPDAEVLDRPITWAHSSDLPDPTPWLEAGQLLLTNGAQLPGEGPVSSYAPYVERLAAAGLGGLGFATEVVHAEVPAGLVDACAASGLPLLEVVGRTPFIVVIRQVAEALAAEQRARLEWSLAAHRALARAALRPDGLASVLRELERQLDCWVALFDAAGEQVPVRTTIGVPASVLGEVRRSVRDVLRRGHRAGMRLTAAGGDVTLQTLGQRDHLRGVLAVGTATPLDPAGSDLVTSVIALASISVEQGRALDAARADLRAGLLELMLAGSLDVARASADRVGDRLPAEPLRVTVFATTPDAGPLRQELGRPTESVDADWFVADRGPVAVVVHAAGDVDRVADVLRRHEVRGGSSGPGGWRDLARLVREAERALERGTGSELVTRFESMYGSGMLALLDDRGAAEVAARLLDPLTAHPDGETLRTTLEVWLRHGCAWDPAARELGVHRHTLRNRTNTVERLLGLDLGTFGARAELWMALQLTGDPPA